MTLVAQDIFPRERYGLITGSECSVMFPDKYKPDMVGVVSYARSLAIQKYFQFYDLVGTWQMEHGNLCEPIAAEFYAERFDSSIIKADWKKHEHYEAGGSADYLVPDIEGIDFKCPTTLEKWLSYRKGIDHQQYCQAQMYMFVYGFEKWSVCAFLMETDKMSNLGISYPVPIEKRLIKTEIDVSKEWQRLLIERMPNVIEKRNAFIAEFKELIEN